MPRKNKNLIALDARLYENKPVNDLILFSIFSVTEKGERCTFERLVKECFSLFPRSFCFSQYRPWPDSRKLDRPLRSLRKKKLISGDPKTFFSLTETGKDMAGLIAKILRQRRLKI